jgi:hypothetical protein
MARGFGGPDAEIIPKPENDTGIERPRHIESSGGLTAKHDMVKVG